MNKINQDNCCQEMKAEEWRKKKTVRVVAVANIRRYYKK
jgi:hypothetical protein